MNHKKVFVSCSISRGPFSAERVFEIKQYHGPEYVGIAPVHYCVKSDGTMFGAAEPEHRAEGKLAARLIDNGDDHAHILIPDGESIRVGTQLISDRVAAG